MIPENQKIKNQIPSKDYLVNISDTVDNTYELNVLKTKNLCDKQNISTTYWDSSTNKILYDTTNSSYSIYIDIEPSTTYTISKGSAGHTFRVATTLSIPYNDAGTSVISTTADHTATSITITTESNAKYLWVVFFNSNSGDTGSYTTVLDTLQIEKGSTATTYTPFVKNEIKADNDKFTDTLNVNTEVDSKSNVNILKTKNLFNMNTMQSGYLTNEGKLISDYLSSYLTSDYILVKPNTQYIISITPSEEKRICFYDNAKTFISCVSNTQTFLTPDKTQYIRFTQALALDLSVQLEEGCVSTSFTLFKTNEININNEKYSDTLNIGPVEDNRDKLNLLCSTNLATLDNIYMEKGLDNVTGNMVANQTSRVCVYKIPVKPNHSYNVTCASGYLIGNIFNYDINGNFTSMTESEYAQYKYVVNVNNYFISFVLRNTNNTAIALNEKDKLKVVISDKKYSSQYTPFVNNEVVVDEEKFTDTVNVGPIEDIKNKLNVLHSRNLINPQYATTSQNGITITNNGDGTFSLDGTATDTVIFYLMNDLNLNGTYKLSGCPNDGSTTTYYLFAVNAAWTKFIGDTGDGKQGTFDSTVSKLAITVATGITCNNVLFKPMISEDLTLGYNDFEPYIINQINVEGKKYSDTINVGLTEDNKSRVNVLKSKNLLNCNSFSSWSVTNVSITSSYTNGKLDYINATKSATTTNNIFADIVQFNFSEPTGTYKLSGCPSGGGNNTYSLYLVDNTTTQDVYPRNEGSPASVTLTKGHKYTLYLRMANTTTFSDKKFYPMITQEAETNDIYEPYIVPSIKVNNEEIYSKGLSEYLTTEQRIGSWLGKPLYRQVVNFGALPNTSTKQLAHNIANINNVVNISGYAIDTNNYSISLPNGGNNTSFISCHANRTNVYVITGSDRSAYNGYVVLEYTKTTD